MTTVDVKLPKKLVPVFAKPRGAVRFRYAFGGRGSTKSASFATMAAVFGYMEPLRFLCIREFQNSIKESMLAEIKSAIDRYPFLVSHYEIGENYIRGKNGTEFLFKGTRHNVNAVKSMSGVDILIADEADDIPAASWLVIEPTIRNPKSEIWCLWNPNKPGSWVDDTFRQSGPPPDAIGCEINWRDNPWFSNTPLAAQRERAAKTMDAATYAWVWEGAYLTRSKAQIFGDKFKSYDFEPKPEWNGPYYGLDFGFATDPSAGVKCWVHDRVLYVERECGGHGIELDALPDNIKSGLGADAAKMPIRCDSSRPESISHIRRHGITGALSVDKWPGSVEDGIAFIKSFDHVAIHPRCVNTLAEFGAYSYKIDRLSGDVLPVIVDANNHWIDALRYAIAKLIKIDNGFFVG